MVFVSVFARSRLNVVEGAAAGVDEEAGLVGGGVAAGGWGVGVDRA